jgi:hypothetical protein
MVRAAPSSTAETVARSRSTAATTSSCSA